MNLEANAVSRAVERKAHGLVPLLAYEWWIIGSMFVIGVAFVHAFAGVGLAVATVAALLIGRWRWDQRREWLVLWLRRFAKQRRYCLLDADSEFRPYRR